MMFHTAVESRRGNSCNQWQALRAECRTSYCLLPAMLDSRCGCRKQLYIAAKSTIGGHSAEALCGVQALIPKVWPLVFRLQDVRVLGKTMVQVGSAAFGHAEDLVVGQALQSGARLPARVFVLRIQLGRQTVEHVCSHGHHRAALLGVGSVGVVHTGGRVGWRAALRGKATAAEALFVAGTW